MKAKQLPDTIAYHEQVVKWSEKFKAPMANRLITFPAKQYQQWTEALLPKSISSIKTLEEIQARKKGYKIGRFVYYLRPLPMWRWGSRYEQLGIPSFLFPSSNVECRNKLQLFKGGDTIAYCAFDGHVNIPIIGTQSTNDSAIEPWMSLTPNEVLTQRGQVRRAKGKVGLAGLGMGWAARRILERKQVKHLTIIEQDLDIIKLFGTPLKEQFQDKLTLICGDAYEQDWQQFDVSIWDIWERFNDCSLDKKFLPIHRQLEQNGKTCVYWGSMAY
ncbi:hypothetical protein N9045_01170 [bacterium]|nr:hypothetical protein [bacterium]